MQDGIVENFTAGMTDPYFDGDGNPTGNRGKSFIDPGALKDYVTALDAQGFQCHFHAIGDRGVHESLDAIEAARQTNGWNDLRHHIAHIQLIRPEDLPRFRSAGAVANAQPLWACSEGQMEHLTIPFIGGERASWQYPFRSLERAGAVMAMGSDWAVSTPNPLLEMEVAVRRIDPRTAATRRSFPTSASASGAPSTGSRSGPRTSTTWTARRGRSRRGSWPTCAWSTVTCSRPKWSSWATRRSC